MKYYFYIIKSDFEIFEEYKERGFSQYYLSTNVSFSKFFDYIEKINNNSGFELKVL